MIYTALDYIANTLYSLDCRDRGLVATRWWCLAEEHKATWRVAAQAFVNSWSAEEAATKARYDRRRGRI